MGTNKVESVVSRLPRGTTKRQKHTETRNALLGAEFVKLYPEDDVYGMTPESFIDVFLPKARADIKSYPDVLCQNDRMKKIIDELIQNGLNNHDPLCYAVFFIKHKLRNGPKMSNEINKEAKESKVDKKLLEKAKKLLGVKCTREGNKWYLSL